MKVSGSKTSQSSEVSIKGNKVDATTHLAKRILSVVPKVQKKTIAATPATGAMAQLFKNVSL